MKQKVCSSDFGLYREQVGGHHCIISYKDFILKPYDHNESYIYSIIPYKFPKIVNLVPKYYGVVDLNLIDSPTSDLTSSFESEKINEDPGKDMKEVMTMDGMSVINQEETDKEQWLDSLFHRRFDCNNTSNSEYKQYRVH